MFMSSNTSSNPMSLLREYRGHVGLLEILNRGYFQRSWIVQEMVLAKRISIFVGPMELPLEHLRRAIQFKSKMEPLVGIMSRQERPGAFSVLDVLQCRDDRLNGKPWHLEDYVSLCRDRLATNPRDKVYSILGLVDESHRPKLGDNAYAISEAKAYVDFTAFLAKQIGWQRVLSFVGNVEPGCKNLPSWAPDYSVSVRPKPFSFHGCTMFKAASSCVPYFKFAEGGGDEGGNWTFTLSAAHLDVVEQVGEITDMCNMFQITQLQGHMLDIVTKVGRHYPPTGELTMDVFFSTLTANIFAHSDFDSDCLRSEFMGWLDEVFFTSESIQKSRELLPLVLKAGTSAIRRVRNLPNNSGHDDVQLSLSAVVDAFVEEHDSARFPIAWRALRPESHHRKTFLRKKANYNPSEPNKNQDSKSQRNSTISETPKLAQIYEDPRGFRVPASSESHVSKDRIKGGLRRELNIQDRVQYTL